MTRLVLTAALGVAVSSIASASGGGAPIVPLNSPAPTAMPTAMPAPAGFVAPDAVPTPGAVMGQRFGLLPFLRKGVWWKNNYGACESCETPAPKQGLFHGGHAGLGHGHSGLGHGHGHGVHPGLGVPGVPQPGQPGLGMPGTLVFPMNPYLRSPRDFFMYEPR